MLIRLGVMLLHVIAIYNGYAETSWPIDYVSLLRSLGLLSVWKMFQVFCFIVIIPVMSANLYHKTFTYPSRLHIFLNLNFLRRKHI